MAHTYKNNPIDLPQVFSTIAAKTFSAIMPELNTNLSSSMVPLFLHGTTLEIVKELEVMSNDYQKKNSRFPLIALIGDPIMDYSKNDLNPTFNGTIIIVNLTEQTYNSEARRLRNFIPILRPLYAEFVSQVNKSNLIVHDYGQVFRHKYTEHYHWGKDGLYGHNGYQLNEFIDGIELSNIELKLNLPNCLNSGLTGSQTKSNF